MDALTEKVFPPLIGMVGLTPFMRMRIFPVGAKKVSTIESTVLSQQRRLKPMFNYANINWT